MIKSLLRILIKKKLKISFAESCTGGLLASTITSISGASKIFNLGWGIIAILFSLFFAQEENLIESINIIASLLYGNVLGIFLVAFFLKSIKSNNIFYAAIISQILVFLLFNIFEDKISYLWFNFIGTFLTSSIAVLFYTINRKL